MSVTGLLITNAGAAAILADLSGGTNLVLSHVAWGDANGVPYNPVPTQTALAREKYRTTVASMAVVDGVLYVDAIFPADTNDASGRPSHGFNVSECGLFASDGTMIGVARMGNGFKSAPGSGVAVTAAYRLGLAVANPSAITVQIDASQQIHLGRMVRPFFLAIDGVLNAPPALPASGASYVIGAAPTGAWTGFGHSLAQWVGVWVITPAPIGHLVVDNSASEASASRYLRRTAGGWVSANVSKTAVGLIDAKKLRSQDENFVQAADVGGTANAITLAFSPAFASVADLIGVPIRFAIEATNTAAVTVTPDAIAPQPLTWPDGTALANGDAPVGAWVEIMHDGTAFRMQQCLSPTQVRSPAFRLASAYLGFHGDPVSQSFANNVQARVSNYTSITNNLPGSAHTAGVITIGTTGFYAVTANMKALMPNPVSNYGYVIAVSVVDGSNNPISSIAALPVSASTAIVAGSLAGAASGIAKLTAGDKIAVFFQHNQGSSQNMSISLDVEFRGA